MHCKECDEYIPPSSRFCSECGRSTSGVSNHDNGDLLLIQQAGTDSMCVGSAIAGVIALFLPLFGVTGVIAIVCGAKGMSNTNETGMGGRGLATLGMILGVVSIVCVVILLTTASVSLRR